MHGKEQQPSKPEESGVKMDSLPITKVFTVKPPLKVPPCAGYLPLLGRCELFSSRRSRHGGVFLAGAHALVEDPDEQFVQPVACYWYQRRELGVETVAVHHDTSMCFLGFRDIAEVPWPVHFHVAKRVSK